LWGIVNKTEVCPDQATHAEKNMPSTRQEVIMLWPSLLYFPPVLDWGSGGPQLLFRSSSPGNFKENLGEQTVSQEKAVLHETDRRVHERSHQEYMTEIFRELAVVAEPALKEDQVVHLLASLPGSYDVLVTCSHGKWSGDCSTPGDCCREASEGITEVDGKGEGRQ
jgi:hypothetical protein